MRIPNATVDFGNDSIETFKREQDFKELLALLEKAEHERGYLHVNYDQENDEIYTEWAAQRCHSISKNLYVLIAVGTGSQGCDCDMCNEYDSDDNLEEDWDKFYESCDHDGDTIFLEEEINDKLSMLKLQKKEV